MTTPAALDIDGPAAPPRSNGELVFAEPWQSRAFGLAVTLVERGAFTWDQFRDALIARIAEWERDHPPGQEWNYYRCWLDAVETLATERGMVASAEVATRAEALADRPDGHDHEYRTHEHRTHES